MKYLLSLLALVLATAALNAAPANDNFAAAQLVNVPIGGVVVSGNNLDATRETNEPDTHGSGKSVWYRIDAAAAGNGIRITSVGSEFLPHFAVYRGSFATGLSALQVEVTGYSIFPGDVSSTYRQVDFVMPTSPTEDFFFAVGSSDSSSAKGAIQLNFTTFVPPANDAFANAQLVIVPTGGVNVSGSNLEATREPNEPNNHGDKKSLWYRIDSAASGKGIRITSAGSGFSPEIALYHGSSTAGISALQLVETEYSVSNGAGSYSQVDFAIPAGSPDTFFIAVGSSDSSGAIQLNFTTFTPPLNDNLVNAQLVNLQPGGVNVAGHNLGATRETNEPTGHGSENSVWYRIASPAAGTGILVTVDGDDFFPTMAVYRGNPAAGVGSLEVVRDSSSRIDFVVPAAGGADYLIGIGGYSYQTAGHFDLRVSTFALPTNDDIVDSEVIGVTSGNATVIGSTLGATTEASEGDHASVWYRIRTPLPGTRFFLDASGSEYSGSEYYSTKIAVYTGNPGAGFPGLKWIPGPYGSGSGLKIPDGPLQDYLIQVVSPIRGAIRLDITAIANPALIITGVIDGTRSGGLPKAVELFALRDIPDLGIYAIGVADNGGGSDGPEIRLSGTLSKGKFLRLSSESSGFNAFFGSTPELVSSLLSVDGDDAVELFYDPSSASPGDEIVIDSFGEAEVDGTGKAWEYTDSWAYRIDKATPNLGAFSTADWRFLGPGGLVGKTTNSPINASSFPLATFLSGELLFPANARHPFERFDGEDDPFDLDHKTFTLVPVNANETDPNKWAYHYTVSDAPVLWLDLATLDPDTQVSNGEGSNYSVAFPFYGELRSVMNVGGANLDFDGAQQRIILPSPGSTVSYDNSLRIGQVGGITVIQSEWKIDYFGTSYELRPGQSRYQIELFPSGMIRISFHGVQSHTGALGIVEGSREPVEVDLSLAQLKFAPAVLNESATGSPVVTLPRSQPSEVAYSLLVAPVSALPSNDYLVNGESGIVASNGNTSPLPISILDDSISEQDERFEVILRDPSDPAWILGRTDFWIIDDDVSSQASNNPILQTVGDRVRISPSTPLVPSGNYQVRIRGIAGGSVFGADGRTLLHGALVSLTEAATGLGISNSGVTFSVEFILVSSGKVVGKSYHRYTRTGSQPTFRFSSPANVTVQEGTTLSLSIELVDAGNLDGEMAFSVDHQLIPITATRFSSSTGDFIVQPAEIRNGSRTIEIPIVADGLTEGNETFEVRLTNPSPGAILGTPAAVTVTILNSSGPVEEGTSPYSQVLPMDTAFSTITLDGEGKDWRFAGDPFWYNGAKTLAARRPGLYVTRYPDGGSETVINGVPLQNGYAYQNIVFTDPDTDPGRNYSHSNSIKVPARNGTGSLQMVLEPVAGRWRRLGQTTWRSSGFVEGTVPTGLQFVEFEDSVSSHFPPALLKVNVAATGTTVAAKYQPKQTSAPNPVLSPLETQVSTVGYPIVAATSGPPPRNDPSDWIHIPFPAQSGEFALTCDVQTDYFPVNSTIPIDVLVGLSSSSSVDHWSEVSVVGRAFRANEISDYFWDAHTGGGSCSSNCFSRLDGVPIFDDTQYRLKFLVNVPAKTFCLEVEFAGSESIVVAKNAPFRASATSLGYLTLRNVQGKIRLLAPPRVVPYPDHFAGRVESGRGFGSGTVVSKHAVLTSADLVFNRDKLSYYEDIAWRCSAGQAGVVPEVNEPSGVILLTGYAEGLLRDDADSPIRDAQNVAVLGFIPRIHPNLPGSGGYSGIRIDDGSSNWKATGVSKRMPFFPFSAVAAADLGKMHYLDGNSVAFSPLGHGVFSVSSGFSPPPGAEGAALFVQTSGGSSLPAAVYLGSRNGASLFREIDERIAMAIRATANIQDQLLSNGGHILFDQNASKGGIYYIETSLRERDDPNDGVIDAASIPAEIRWKIKSRLEDETYNGGSLIGVTPWEVYTLTFEPAPPGFVLDSLVFDDPVARTIKHTLFRGETWPIPKVYLPDPTTYQTWKLANYTSVEISSSPTERWGVESDEMALFLSVENVVAYALGFDPKEGTTRNADPDTMTPGFPILRRDPANGGLYFEFLRRKDAGLRYFIESSSTLDGPWPGSLNASWPNNPAPLEVVNSNLVWQHVRFPLNPLPGTRKFVRLGMTLVE